MEKNLRLRIQSLDMQDRINEVLVPTEEEVVFFEFERPQAGEGIEVIGHRGYLGQSSSVVRI